MPGSPSSIKFTEEINLQSFTGRLKSVTVSCNGKRKRVGRELIPQPKMIKDLVPRLGHMMRLIEPTAKNSRFISTLSLLLPHPDRRHHMCSACTVVMC